MDGSPAPVMSSGAITTSPSISHNLSLRPLATPAHPHPQPSSIQSTASTPKPTTRHPTAMFTSFPNLPPELRLHIWELAANTPRNVDLWATSAMFTTNPDSNSPRNRQWGVRYHSLAAVPSVLHACWEARAVALRFYERGFDGEGEAGIDANGAPAVAGIWINWAVDTVVPMELWRWSGEALGELFGSSGAGKLRGIGAGIRHLALNAEIGDWRCAWFLGLRLESLVLYYRERALGLAGVLELRGRGGGGGGEGGAGVILEDLVGGGAREIEGLRRAREYVYWEFAELAALQARLKEEEEEQEQEQEQENDTLGGGGGGLGGEGEVDEVAETGFGATARTRMLQSPLFSDAFSRSAGWLDAELEVAFRRASPRIGFARMRVGGEV